MKRILNPRRIEAKSFEIIGELLPNLKLPDKEREVVKRVVHATADLDYGKELLFHPEAIEAGLKAIREGENIVVDVNMVKAGVNERILRGLGGKVVCLINEEDVVKSALELGITKTAMAMRKADRLMNKAIVAIGNAPTALFELCNLAKKGKARPALIVGVPVGFVGASESKKKLLTFKIPYITNKGSKGGSSVAVAIINALLKLAQFNKKGGGKNGKNS